MTKSEFVDQVSANSGLSKKDAGDAVDAVLQTIEDALKRGSEVTFSGFGKFHVAERSAREGRNPSTGEKIQIAASRVPRFTPGSGLKRSRQELARPFARPDARTRVWLSAGPVAVRGDGTRLGRRSRS